MRLSESLRPRSIRRVHVAYDSESTDFESAQQLTPSDIVAREEKRKFIWREKTLAKIVRGIVRKACACESGFPSGFGAMYKDVPADFQINATTEGVVLWQTAQIESGYIAYDSTLGTFTPSIEGLYSVHAWLYDEYANGSGTIELRIYGNGATNTLARGIYSGSYLDIRGSKLVYCNGTTDTIKVTLYNGGAGMVKYNSITAERHESYVHINYEGLDNKQTII